MVDKGLPNQARGLPQMNLLGGIPFLPFDSAFFFLPSNSQIPFSLFFATESISLFILLNRSEQGVFIGDETGVRRPKSVLKTKIVTTSSQTNNRDQGFEQNPNHLFPFSNLRSDNKSTTEQIKGTDLAIREWGHRRREPQSVQLDRHRGFDTHVTDSALQNPNFLYLILFRSFHVDGERDIRRVGPTEKI